MLQSLSIVTITYNNPEELLNTYNSLESFRKAGGQHIIVNGGTTINHLIGDDCFLLEEPDKGIYDALNKGIELVQTPYLMLIHSGDFLIAPLNVLEKQLNKMREEQFDMMLNDCTIEFGKVKRLMSAKNWRPWMFKLGAQPPHPPIIYRRNFIAPFHYDIAHPIIADFKYLEELFSIEVKYDYGDELLIHMNGGGATSSGITSFLEVTKQFKKLKGAKKMIVFTLFRPLIKACLMLK